MLSEDGRVTLLGVFVSLIVYYTMSVDIKNEIKDFKNEFKDFKQQVSNEFKNVNTRFDQLSDIFEKKK